MFEPNGFLEFKISESFDATNELDVRLVMLMAGANDIMGAIWHFNHYLEQSRKDVANEIQKLVYQAHSNYFFRLGCSHALETLKILEKLDLIPDFKNTISKNNDLYKLYTELKSQAGDLKPILSRLRCKATFHYDYKAFKKSLCGFTKEKSKIVTGRTIMEYRFILADDVQANTMSFIKEDEHKKIYGGIAALQGALVGFLHCFLPCYLNITFEDKEMENDH